MSQDGFEPWILRWSIPRKAVMGMSAMLSTSVCLLMIYSLSEALTDLSCPQSHGGGDSFQVCPILPGCVSHSLLV